MTFQTIDPGTGEIIECDGRAAVCATQGCENFGIEIQVPNAGQLVICGPCGNPIPD